jgi:hypothetical protein
VSNNDNYKDSFKTAKEAILKHAGPRKGIKVFSPAELSLDGKDWEHCMRETLKLMLSCNCVVLLPEIRDYVSRGAVIEQLVASSVNMDIFTLDGFMKIFAPVPF